MLNFGCLKNLLTGLVFTTWLRSELYKASYGLVSYVLMLVSLQKRSRAYKLRRTSVKS
jgi:hypothetical protein